ncbi:MAG: hypothetical protein FWF81_12190 [Defluviitaleaceae bacterium]|nr:hypothetical protein [Defluviitaleaceae bacterium]
MIGKYGTLFPPLVERIFSEESSKKDPVKSAKTRLHQIYGAYFQGNKKASKLLDAQEIEIEKILKLHASTRERLPYISEFYGFIEAHTCAVKSVLDLGCGFNPFAISMMRDGFYKNLHAYYAYDIDLFTKEILNRFFAQIGLPNGANCMDLAVQTPPENVDLALALKLLPVIEAQFPKRGFELYNALNAQFLVISYPLKSLGGREKGMGKNYSAAFERALDEGLLNNFSLVASEKIGNELVYILRGGG